MRVFKGFMIAVLTLFGFPLFIAYCWLAHSNKVRMERLQKCIDREMPTVIAKYRVQGVSLGEPGDKDLWLDWLDPEEYATYPLLKEGKEIERRYVLFRTDADQEVNGDGGCSASETTNRALE